MFRALAVAAATVAVLLPAVPAGAQETTHVARGPSGDWVEVTSAQADQLRGRADVLVEPDRTMHAFGDPFASSQWSHPKIQLPDAWQLSTGQDITVAVLDTGVDDDHEDLTGRVLPGWDAIEDGPLTAEDTNGHGTMVAGMIVSGLDNGVGIAGAAPHAEVLPVRVLGDSGSGSTSDIAEGVDWAVANGADIINLSLGGTSNSTMLADAVADADAAGVLVLAAAGNEYESGNPRIYPAANDSAWGVGATTEDDTRASFSQVGDWVDLVAPGQSVVSTSTGGGYVYWSGTSAATPVTAAVAALLLTSPHAPTGPSRDDWAADILMGTAVDLGPAGRDDEFGNGRVDAAAAASAAYPSTSETLELTAPEKGQQVLDELRVRGTADAGTEVTIGVTPDGPSSTAVATGGTFDATLDLTSAPSGELTVTVSAPDAAPQTRTVVHDAARPTVTVTGPARPVPAGTVRVSGTVDDDLHVARVTVVLDMEGDPTQTVHAPGDAFTADFDLGGEPAGTVVAMVTAHDEAGRSRTVSHQIDITAATGPGPHRVSGQTRWDTAVAVSSAAFPGGADVVYVATGENFPDALSAVAAAAVEDAPVLITPRTVLPDPVANELARLAPRHVKVVGGTSAVSDAVVDAVAGAAGDVPVTRLAGDDRYATSATVASHPGFVDDTVFLATGQDFPDALAAGSAAARGGHRLLLTDPGDLPQPTATLLRLVKPDRVVVVGGAVAVDDTVIDAVSDLLPEAVVDRVAGSDRFDTAARLSAEFITSDMVWVATGRGFADALSAGAAAARAGAPLLLTEKADLPPVTADRVGALGARTALIAGGPVAVGDTVVDQLASLL